MYRKPLWRWIVLAIVLLAVIGVIGVWYRNTHSGFVPQRAASGKIVNGFPEQLVVPSSSVANSYAINYPAGASQYTTEWISTSSGIAVLNNYLTSLPSQGWKVSGTANKPFYQGVYAVNGNGGQLNIVITSFSSPDGTKGSKITVTYLAASH